MRLSKEAKTKKPRMNNQELNFRAMEKSTRSCGRRRGPYGYAFNALTKLWLGLVVGLLLIPGVTRAQQYVFENVAFPGDTFTQLLGINDADVIAGYHGQAINKGFTLTLPNNFTSENFPSSAQTQVTGINNSSNTSGFYIDNGGTNHGFLNIGGNFSTVDFPGTTFDQVLGLNTPAKRRDISRPPAVSKLRLFLTLSFHRGVNLSCSISRDRVRQQVLTTQARSPGSLRPQPATMGSC
jgi:hypothetical protein